MFKKYVSRPVIKEAVQLTHENLEEVAEAIRAAGWEGCFAPPDRIHIPSWEGMITAFPGDWIIKGNRNEFYRCKADIFAETYDGESA
ncbi:MAG: hypothetical protein JKP92_08170 [Alphaproteobacteria bacterium]|jgi:hypothetical protein|nr:hypothetical protein [Alphaproteobacteria bacterium]